MTTIAYRSGTLAADTAYSNGWVVDGRAPKIVTLPDGRLAGACGEASFMGCWLRWCQGGCVGDQPKPGTEKDGQGGDTALIVELDGSLTVYEGNGSFNYRPEYVAYGSGRGVALGAMWMGASAEEAIKAAILHDTHTRGSVTVLALPGNVVRIPAAYAGGVSWLG